MPRSAEDARNPSAVSPEEARLQAALADALITQAPAGELEGLADESRARVAAMAWDLLRQRAPGKHAVVVGSGEGDVALNVQACAGIQNARIGQRVLPVVAHIVQRFGGAARTDRLELALPVPQHVRRHADDLGDLAGREGDLGDRPPGDLPDRRRLELGRFGQLHPQLRQQRQLPAEVYVFQLNWSALETCLVPVMQKSVKFLAYSAFPASDRDLAFYAPLEATVADLTTANFHRLFRKAA